MTSRCSSVCCRAGSAPGQRPHPEAVGDRLEQVLERHARPLAVHDRIEDLADAGEVGAPAVLGQIGEQLGMGRAQRPVDLAVVLARLAVEAAAVEAAAVAAPAGTEVRDRPSALGDVHPQTPVLVALLRGLWAAPAVDL